MNNKQELKNKEEVKKNPAANSEGIKGVIFNSG